MCVEIIWAGNSCLLVIYYCSGGGEVSYVGHRARTRTDKPQSGPYAVLYQDWRRNKIRCVIDSVENDKKRFRKRVLLCIFKIA